MAPEWIFECVIGLYVAVLLIIAVPIQVLLRSRGAQRYTTRRLLVNVRTLSEQALGDRCEIETSHMWVFIESFHCVCAFSTGWDDRELGIW